MSEEGLPSTPNQGLAGDITHIPTTKDWAYLAVVIDLYTRKIVGWKLADNMSADLSPRPLQTLPSGNPLSAERSFTVTVAASMGVSNFELS